MNDFTMYELANQRRAQLIGERRRTSLARAARRNQPRRRERWSDGRHGFALVLRRLADRIEPASRPAHRLALPAQRHLAS